VLNFLYTAVSWVLLRWHSLFTAIGFDKDSGLNWTLSIVFLVITARLLLFRMFVKQVKYQRHMQEMQPKISALREKYKNDKGEMQRQMMKLQQEEGFNPLSGCLPMFLQIPVFIGLFHVLRHLSAAGSETYGKHHPDRLTLYTFSKDETLSAAKAKLFNAPLAASFHDTNKLIHDTLGGTVSTTRVVILVLLVVSAAATMATQLLARANATTTPEGTAATIQKAMLYLIPIGVLASGLLFNFPLGVLLYWFTSNLWTLGQQAYIIRFHPHTPKEVPVTGELGKTLAPKPGARPQRPAKTSLVKTVDADVIDSTTDPTDSTDAPTVRSSTPRPGQRPARPGGGRPPAKRPTQSKKRR
jgi:YidC/Oxa1 family membrane protein insertase